MSKLWPFLLPSLYDHRQKKNYIHYAFITDWCQIRQIVVYCANESCCENWRPPSKTKIASMMETNLWPLIMVVKGHCCLIFDSALENSNCISEGMPCTYFFVTCLHAWCQRPGSKASYRVLRHTTALIYVNACCTISTIDVRGQKPFFFYFCRAKLDHWLIHRSVVLHCANAEELWELKATKKDPRLLPWRRPIYGL